MMLDGFKADDIEAVPSIAEAGEQVKQVAETIGHGVVELAGAVVERTVEGVAEAADWTLQHALPNAESSGHDIRAPHGDNPSVLEP